jgi:16S rRNA C1402 N4-methylase RsmH
LVTKKPLTPGDEELLRNPKSRSAKLRIIARN